MSVQTTEGAKGHWHLTGASRTSHHPKDIKGEQTLVPALSTCCCTPSELKAEPENTQTVFLPYLHASVHPLPNSIYKDNFPKAKVFQSRLWKLPPPLSFFHAAKQFYMPGNRCYNKTS